jgi:uncharacterized protein YqhQ
MASPPSRPYIGGQAVLEGVMMRAPKSFAVVVRRRDGALHVRERAMSADGRAGVARWPFVRGLTTLVESLRLGGEALRFSAEQFEKDAELEAAAGSAGASTLSLLTAFALTVVSLVTRADGEEAMGKPASGAKRGGGILMGIVAVLFFIALPQAASAVVNRVFHLGLDVQSASLQVVTGVLKLAIVIGYLVAIRRVPEIRRVFQYHGAEHKTISTYEAGETLVVDNARRKTTMHPRCGTTFLVMVALVSILFFIAIGASLPRIHTGSLALDNVIFFFEKLPFLPLLVAVTFEIQRLFARYCSTGPLRALLAPGFLVQKITTAEPDDAQLEVALASLRVTLFRQELIEQGEQGEQAIAAERAGATTAAAGPLASDADDITFSSYEALLAAPRLRPETSAARAA